MYKDLLSLDAGDFQNELGKVLVEGFLNSSLEHQIYVMLAAYAYHSESYNKFKTPEEAILGLIDDAQQGLEWLSDKENKSSIVLHNFEMLKEGCKGIIEHLEVQDFGDCNG